ncbi:hypothetical protein DID76_03850 [Candidatus Marinamargulisbacteria bacterium SCGC AG-414-C22]|nr:hypothetical protein DID76_03850 [Candidatus Marinamargulisbacteria bacterium SCGC AG-414-C22]
MLNELVLKKNSKKVPYSNLIQELVNFNYERVDMVFEPGMFSVRGSVIDIFPATFKDPIRIEYDLDMLERISYFRVVDQKTFQIATDIHIIPFEKTDFFKTTTPVSTFDDALVSQFIMNEYIVHEQYGIGIFKGLEFKKFPAIAGEFICLEYKDSSFVYVPLEQLNLIHKYTLYDSDPVLSSLSNKVWQKTKQKVEKDTLEVAEELYHTYHDRQHAKGFKFADDSVAQLDIEETFEHQLTRDQDRVLADIKADMESIKPMDRLLCGDVGFGKTEIMLRAAFKALDNHKQVAILVPTTILAEQHYKLFKARFHETPFISKCLSRFISAKNQQIIINQLKQQQCDLVIGTHRLLSKDVNFADLGLVIIDEEQRFGVQHKEKLRKLRHSCDVLSVTATPIPRTMYMSLTGFRDISIIDSPPPHRKPIISAVNEFDKSLIQKAIDFEINRSGQLYYVCNHIHKINQKYILIKQMYPHLSLAILHGQLPENEIKHIMTRFIQRDIDILLCTSIIENGLDIEHANTIIIDGIEDFGLSQAHQLRGRIGRRHIQGYAYFFHGSNKKLTDNAKQRLQALREYISLGSGYALAMRDLEIRGGGNILGNQQYGHVLKVGFSYYCKLLEQAMSFKKKKSTDIVWLPLRTDKLSPIADFVTNQRERISFYRRFMSCKTVQDLNFIKNDMQDRYGRLPLHILDVFDYVATEIMNKY